MRKPLWNILLLSLIFLSTACGNAKFNGTGSKKKDKQADQIPVEEPVTICKPGETCEPPCKEGEANCPVVPPVCKVGDEGCTIPTPVDECKTDPSKCPVQNDPSQNPGQNSGENPTQNNPNQGK